MDTQAPALSNINDAQYLATATAILFQSIRNENQIACQTLKLSIRMGTVCGVCGGPPQDL